MKKIKYITLLALGIILLNGNTNFQPRGEYSPQPIPEQPV